MNISSTELNHHLSERLWLTDGGLETTLVFHDGIDLPHFAAYRLLGDHAGLDRLDRYYRQYIGIALEHQTGFVLETPTWRASSDWGKLLGDSPTDLARLNRTAVGLLHHQRDTFESPETPVLISGCIGPRGDGYIPGATMSVDEAAAYHLTQIRTLADAGADVISALTMNTVAEATGITQAAASVGIPCAISFTVETDGRLPSGEDLAQAIGQIDARTATPPAYYMINCAHPEHFAPVLSSETENVNRIRGLRANASILSHAELEASTELDDGDPLDLGSRCHSLGTALPGLALFGGCCGTDHRHVACIAAALTGGEAAF